MFCDNKEQLDNPAEIIPLTAERLPEYADVIRKSFATVAKDFGWTKENCPGHTSFITDERLESKLKSGYFPFGLCISDKIIGFSSLTDMSGGTYEMNDVSVLPEYRHYGYGKKLLDFCKKKAKQLGGSKITIGIVEENIVLKEWYVANGFVHTGTKKFDHLPFTVGFMEWSSGKSNNDIFQETNKQRQARVYPVILSEYNLVWPEWYAEEKTNLERLIGMENIARISHFGSTSVPGLTAKPTVDILLEIKEDANINKLIDALSSPEYICLNPPDMPTPPPHLMFLKGYTSTGFAEKVYHIHVRYPGDWDELYFRDYLIAHPETAAEYAALKARLHKGFEHDRDGYTDAKTAFIREVTEKARKL